MQIEVCPDCIDDEGFPISLDDGIGGICPVCGWYEGCDY